MRVGTICGAGRTVMAAMLIAAALGGGARADEAAAGHVCGDARLVGEAIGPLRSAKSAECGAAVGVRVRSISGVAISGRLEVACAAASAMADWVEGSVQPEALTRFGDTVASIAVVDSFTCRRRNRQAGAPWSEHAFGRAVDVAGFTLGGGRQVRVLEHWGGAEGDAVAAADPLTPEGYLRAVERGACGPFTTVLGPTSDRFHQDHFHFDVKPRRNPFC